MGPIARPGRARESATPGDDRTDFDVELVLMRGVIDWAEQVDPGGRSTARFAAQVALDAFAGGASMAEAHSEARQLVVSRLRHPSRGVEPPLRAGNGGLMRYPRPDATGRT